MDSAVSPIEKVRARQKNKLHRQLPRTLRREFSFSNAHVRSLLPYRLKELRNGFLRTAFRRVAIQAGIVALEEPNASTHHYQSVPNQNRIPNPKEYHLEAECKVRDSNRRKNAAGRLSNRSYLER